MRSVLILVFVTLVLLLAVRVTRAQVSPSPSPTPSPQTGLPAQQPAGEEIGPDDVVRVNTTLVTSPALIIGRDSKFVRNLRREDFRIFDEGVEQKLAYFAPVDEPFTVALVIDTSHSMVFDLEDLQDAARAFVAKMRPGDRALIVSFDDQIRVLAEPTSDREALRKAISNMRLGGSTRLYDAIEFTLKQRMDHITGRKALILFSDGVDNASQTATRESSLRDVVRFDVLIYPIQFAGGTHHNEDFERRRPPAGSGFSLQDRLWADAYLHQLARETGVALYPAVDINDLGAAVSSVVEELHNEYSLGYYPSTIGQPGEVRQIEVRVSQPQLQVRARESYVIDQWGAVAQAARPVNVTVAEPPTIGALPVNRSLVPVKLPKEARWICKGPDVPGDFAIVQEGVVAHCQQSSRPNDTTNAWLIRKPAPSETVCKGFLMWQGREVEADAIPSGYVVIGEVVAPGCGQGNGANNAWKVKLPGQLETVCKGFIIPRGYVVRGETVTVACPLRASGKNAWFITPKYVEPPALLPLGPP